MTACVLMPLTWLRDGLPIKGVDSFFSLHPQGRLDSSLYAWDARSSTGQATSDLIAIGLNFIQAVMARLGLSVTIIETIILTTLVAIAVAGVYRLTVLVLRRNAPPRWAPWIGACTSVVWVANPFALSFVWLHQLLIEVTWAAVPWLVYVLLASEAYDWDLLMTTSAVVIVLIAGSAGFPHAYLPGLALLLVVIAVCQVVASKRRSRTGLRVALIAGAVVAGLGWWLVPSLPTIGSLLAAASVGSGTTGGQLDFASQFSTVANVISLTGVPVLHLTVDTTPYVSWSRLVLSTPGSVFLFMFPAVAAIGATSAIWRPRVRRVVVPMTIAVCIAVFLSKGLNPPLENVNAELTNLPLGAFFRHPLDKFSFALILPLCLLFALGLAWLVRYSTSIVAAVLAVLVVCGFLALPWWTGAVIPVGGGRLPSEYVQMPASYDEVGQDLAKSPPGGKTMVLPYSPDGGTAYLWSSGIQPNLDCLIQDWAPQRSLLCRGSGVALADLIPQALAHAVLNRDPRAFDLAKLAGFDLWLVHADWDSVYFAPDVPPPNAISFLVSPTSTRPNPAPVMRSNQIVRFTPTVRRVTFFVRAEAAPLADEKLLEIGPVDLQLNRASGSPPKVYLALFDPTDHYWYPADGAVFATGEWHAVSLSISGGRIFLAVDGTDQGALNLCGDNGCHPTGEHGLPLGHPLNSITVDSPSASSSEVVISAPIQLAGISDRTLSSTNLSIVAATAQLELFSQASLPVVYAARSVYATTNFSDPETALTAAHLVAKAQAPVLVPLASTIPKTEPDSATSWIEDSPTDFHGTFQTAGPCVFVFLQTYDPHWVLTIGNQAVPVADHQIANGFANAWVVRDAGRLSWTLTYDLQSGNRLGMASGVMLLIGAVGVATYRSLWRNRLRRRSRRSSMKARPRQHVGRS